jgi:carbonic anhydrase
LADGTFATVINCMDGRVQLAVNNYVREKFGVDYVDTITMAGPCGIIAEQQNPGLIDNLKFRVDISVNKHFSRIIFIAGHVDCAAVEETDEKQKQLIKQSIEEIKKWESDVQVYGLWINDTWTVQQLN